MDCKGGADARAVICTSHGDKCALCGGPVSGSDCGTAHFCKNHKDSSESCIKCGKEKAKMTKGDVRICKTCKPQHDWGHKCCNGISLTDKFK